jgi:tetratricopeptide (TPR) repeat protein
VSHRVLFALTLPLAALALARCASTPAKRPAAPPPARAQVVVAPPSAAFNAAVAERAAHGDEASLPLFENAMRAAPEDPRAASEYRQAVIRLAAYDRALAFFDKLAGEHPTSANVELNWGYALVDKIPAAGSISRVLLADDALHHFTRSLDLDPTWLVLYTRGNAYLYWPKVFGRVPNAIADLERAVALVRDQPKRHVHVRAWVTLGDAYWQGDQKERARATWREALARFPGEPRLATRLAKNDDEMSAFLYDQLDPNLRVDTSLAELWAPE